MKECTVHRVRPVSYTHLDVYKRHGYEARKEIRRIEEENRKKETKTSDVFVLKKNVMMVHTNEVIERDGGRS